MTKQEMIIQIKELSSLMEEVVVKQCAVGVKRYRGIAKEIEVAPWPAIQETYKFLKSIYEGDYAQYWKIRSEVSEEQWTNYTRLGITGLPEQIAMKDVKLRIMKAFRGFRT